MDKKAKLFTKRIAERLSKESSYKYAKSEDYKEILIRNIENVTKESLKKCLQNNLNLYIQYFGRCLKRFQEKKLPDEENDIKLVQTWQDCENLCRLDKQDTRLLCVRVLLKQLEHAEKDVVSLVDQFEGKCLGEAKSPIPAWMTSTKHLLVSTNNMAVITKLMLYYLLKLIPVVDEALKTEANTEEILVCLKSFLVMAQLRSLKFSSNDEDCRPRRRDILASLVSIYIDLYLFVNRDSEKEKKISREIMGFTSYLLGGNWSMRLDVLIQVNSSVDDPHLITFVRSCLDQVPSTLAECDTYLKLMICLRKFRDHIQDTVQQSYKIRAPLGFMDWLSEKSPEVMAEIPDDVRFKGRQITYFLLNNQSDELQSLLEDVLTDEDFVANYVNNKDRDTDQEEVMESESTELFVMDRKGKDETPTKKMSKKMTETLRPEIEEEENFEKAGRNHATGTHSTGNSEQVEVVDLSDVLNAIYKQKPTKNYMGADYVSNSSLDSPKKVTSFKIPSGKTKSNSKTKNRLPDDTIVLDTETSSDAEDNNGMLMAPDLLQHLKHTPSNQRVCIVDDSDDLEIKSVTKTDERKIKKKMHSSNSDVEEIIGNKKSSSSAIIINEEEDVPESEMINLSSDGECVIDSEDVSCSKAKVVQASSKSFMKSPNKSSKSETTIVIEEGEDSQEDGKVVQTVMKKSDSRSSVKGNTLSVTESADKDINTKTVPRLKSPKKSNSISESDQTHSFKLSTMSPSPNSEQENISTTRSPSKKRMSKSVKSPEVTVTSSSIISPIDLTPQAKSSSPLKNASSVVKLSEYIQNDPPAAGGQVQSKSSAIETPSRVRKRKSSLSVIEMGSIVKEAQKVTCSDEMETELSVCKKKRRSSKLDLGDGIEVRTPQRDRKDSKNVVVSVSGSVSGIASEKRKSSEESVSIIHSKDGDTWSNQESILGSSLSKGCPGKGPRRKSRKSTSSSQCGDDDLSDAGKVSTLVEDTEVVFLSDRSEKAPCKATPDRWSKRMSSASELEDSVFFKSKMDTEVSPKKSETKCENDNEESAQKLKQVRVSTRSTPRTRLKTPKSTPSRQSATPFRSSTGKRPKSPPQCKGQESAVAIETPSKSAQSRQTVVPTVTPKSAPSRQSKTTTKSSPNVDSEVFEKTAVKSIPRIRSKTPKTTPSKETPRRTRSSIIDSPMITRSGKKINVSRKLTRTPETTEVKKFLPNIQEDDEVVLSNSPRKQAESPSRRWKISSQTTNEKCVETEHFTLDCRLDNDKSKKCPPHDPDKSVFDNSSRPNSFTSYNVKPFPKLLPDMHRLVTLSNLSEVNMFSNVIANLHKDIQTIARVYNEAILKNHGGMDVHAGTETKPLQPYFCYLPSSGKPVPELSKPDLALHAAVSLGSTPEQNVDPKVESVRLKHHVRDYCPELQGALLGIRDTGWLDALELELLQSFKKPQDPFSHWREGSRTLSFVYLLLDPRITRNLPQRAASLDDKEVFQIFIRAIFYIGKGKGERAYAHLYKALSHLQEPRIVPPNADKSQVDSNMKHILDIWKSKLGVIGVQCFHNTMAVDAYTREACMIEAIGLSNLTNKKVGVYYGKAETWSWSTRRMFGVYLLQRALKIFLNEGERQICPVDLKQ